MSWLLIGADGEVAGGPFETEPEPGPGQRAVVALLGYPETMAWSAAKGGFVDLRLVRRVSLLAFQRRFMPAELVALDRTTDTELAYAVIMARASPEIDLDSAEVAAVLERCVELEILTPERAAAIVA